MQAVQTEKNVNQNIGMWPGKPVEFFFSLSNQSKEIFRVPFQYQTKNLQSGRLGKITPPCFGDVLIDIAERFFPFVLAVRLCDTALCVGCLLRVSRCGVGLTE